MCLTSLNEVISIIYIIIIIIIIIINYFIIIATICQRLEAPTYLFGQNCLSDIV